MTQRTKWHEILGAQLKLLLTPLNITVQTNLDVMSGSPQADILLLRANEARWTEEQKACLPDGVRDTPAQQVLIEFKFSESLIRQHLRKIQGYQAFYQQSQTLTDKQVQSFILTAKTPRAAFRRRYGYQPSQQTGVYHSTNPLLDDIPLITLNQLADTPHNAYAKCFASRATERRKAFAQLDRLGWEKLSRHLWLFLLGLRHTLKMEGEIETMQFQITAEDIAHLGQQMSDEYLREWMLTLPAKERIQGLRPEEVMTHYKPEELLSFYKPEDVLSLYEPEDVLPLYEPEDVLSLYEPEDVLFHHKSMEDYLTDQKKALLIQGLHRTLRIRFGVSESDWDRYQQQLERLDFATLEQLSEVVLLVSDEAAFAQALDEIIPSNAP